MSRDTTNLVLGAATLVLLAIYFATKKPTTTQPTVQGKQG